MSQVLPAQTTGWRDLLDRCIAIRPDRLAVFADFANTVVIQLDSAGILWPFHMRCQYCFTELPADATVCAQCQSRPVAVEPGNSLRQHDEDTAELPVLMEPKRGPGTLAWLIVAGVGLAGITAYFGIVRPRMLRDVATHTLRAQLDRIGAPKVVATIDNGWNLQLSGTVEGEVRHVALLAAARGQARFKSIVDAVAVTAIPADIAKRVSGALETRWPRQYSVSVGPKFAAVVSGLVDSAAQRAAVLEVVGAQTGVASVSDGTSASPTWRRNDLRRFLAAKHWRFVTAVYRDDGSIQLTGVVANENDARKVTADLRQAFPDVPIQSQLTIWRKQSRRR